ncbi:MAG: DUF2062 domain-containing protein [Candidatus Omnitrophica bacterium]|nr:DUF2062 domain-containing protein [Candidatus Omnitrophota bacterium]MBL7151676.1 DUF2062 domain-containing protein [Candidatus Omnitrophota bacterium]
MKRLKERIVGLLKLNTTPHEIALGVGIGVFIAILPLYGFHTLLVILFAIMIRRANKIAILVGTNISLPPTLPLITWAGYSIGKLFLGDSYPALNWQIFKNFDRQSIFNLYYPLFLGSVVLGLSCAFIFYLIILFFLKRRERHRKICSGKL